VDTPSALKENFQYRILELKVDEKNLDFINDLPEVVDAGFYGDKYHVVVSAIERARAVITNLLSEKKIDIIQLNEIQPSMEDVFVALTEKEVV